MNNPNPPVSTEELERWKKFCLFNEADHLTVCKVWPRLIAEVERLTALDDCSMCDGTGKVQDSSWIRPTLCPSCKGRSRSHKLERELTRLQSLLRQSQEENGQLLKDVANMKAIAISLMGEPKCFNCGKPASCFGRYEDQTGSIDFACKDCCGCGNEDGWCIPISEQKDSKRLDWLEFATNQNYLFGNFVMGGSNRSLRIAIDAAIERKDSK